VETQENSPVTAHLVLHADQGMSAEQIADAVLSAWQEIDDSLSPILGHGGVAALYGRSLYLTSANHRFLSGVSTGVGTGMDLVNLKSALMQLSSANAAAAGGALLQTFYILLTSMVGPTLTERLLRSAWENLLSGRPAQDKTP
jgi:hypothetical protein